MTSTTQLLGLLYSIRDAGYGNSLPGPYDDTFVELARAYGASDASARARIRSAVADDMRLLLLGFSDRLATLADRKKDADLLWYAFLAHSIEDFRYDERENIFRLGLLHHVAQKLGIDASSLFERAATLSSERSAECLRAFDARRPELKSLKAMGIIEEQSDSGVNYRYR